MRVIGLNVPIEEQKKPLPVVEEVKEEVKEEEEKESPPVPEKRGRGRPKKNI